MIPLEREREEFFGFIRGSWVELFRFVLISRAAGCILFPVGRKNSLRLILLVFGFKGVHYCYCILAQQIPSYLLLGQM